MKTNRRNFAKTAAALIAGFSCAPALVIPADDAVKTALPVTDQYGWAWMMWRGDVDAILEFGNSGECPLWGHDFMVNTENKTVEFLSFSGAPGYEVNREVAKIGDIVLRAPNGVFLRIPGHPALANSNEGGMWG